MDVPAPSPGGSLMVLGLSVLLALALLVLVVRQRTLLRRNRDAEEARTAAEAEYRWLFETMAQGVVAHAADGTIVAANPAAERVLGLTLDQMRGVTSMDPRWQMVLEDGVPVSAADHPSMIALRTGEVVGPVTRSVRRPDRDEHVSSSR